MASFDITSDTELKDRIRDETQYEDESFELPNTDLDGLIDTAKMKVALESGSEDWYSDRGLGLALLAYSCMRAKASMENAGIEGYELGDQEVTVSNANPDTSQQIQQWADDVATGLSNADTSSDDGPSMRNTSSYIGEQYI